MKRLALIISGLISAYLIYGTLVLYNQIQEAGYKISKLSAEIEGFNNDVTYLNTLPDGEIDSMEDSYRYLDDDLRLYVRSQNLKVQVSLEGMKNGASLLSLSKESSLKGIKQLWIRSSFIGISKGYQLIKIFKFFKSLEKEYPIQVESINHVPNGLEISFKLYGR